MSSPETRGEERGEREKKNKCLRSSRQIGQKKSNLLAHGNRRHVERGTDKVLSIRMLPFLNGTAPLSAKRGKESVERERMALSPGFL